MRTLGAVLMVLALSGSVSLQEDGRLRELLRKLDDDAIEVRAAAATSLAELGKAALPALEKAAAEAGAELRERLAEVLRKIRERERLASILPQPSRITLDARDMPIRGVFEKLSRQTGTAIDYSAIPEAGRVTLSLDRVPLWTAIDQVCRASGRVMADVGPEHVVISPDPFIALPGKITDLFCVTLQRVDLSSKGAFGQQDRFEHFGANFHVAWEKGVHPYRVMKRMIELVDENGIEVVTAADNPEFEPTAPIAPDMIRLDFDVDSDRGPGPGATRLARLKVEIDLEFALKFAEVKVGLAAGKFPVDGECPEFSARLLRFERLEDEEVGTLILTPRLPIDGDLGPDTVTVILRDKAGKEYPATLTPVPPTNENEIPYQLGFTQAPEDAVFTEIVIRIPTEVHHERLIVDLKDLPLK